MTEQHLTDSPLPDLEDPRPLGPLHGDVRDDDGIALDQFFEATYQGPPVESESQAYAELSTPILTRLISRRVTVGTVGGVLYDPVQVLPADANRRDLIVDADGIISIGSDKTDVYQSGVINPSSTPWQTGKHSGAVWVYSTSDQPVSVSVWAVTS